jgi:hypothetical protein
MKIISAFLLLYCLILHFTLVSSKKYLFPTKSEEENKENDGDLLLQFNSLFSDDAVFASKEQKEKFKSRFTVFLLKLLSDHEQATTMLSRRGENVKKNDKQQDFNVKEFREEDFSHEASGWDDVTSNEIDPLEDELVSDEYFAEDEKKYSASVVVPHRAKPSFVFKELLRTYNPEIFNILSLFKQQVSADFQLALSYLPSSIQQSLLNLFFMLNHQIINIKQKLTSLLRHNR